jgi:hypothetical protein
MATEQQILANKRNAAKSSGPRTQAGKSRASQNARKTGAYSKLLLLPDEDPKEFDRLRAALYEEWRPVGPTECNRLERLMALFWQQRRFYRAQAGLYAMYRDCKEGVGGVATALAKDGKETEAFTRLLKMDAAVEHSIGIALSSLQELQQDRPKRAGHVEEPPSSSMLPCPEI